MENKDANKKSLINSRFIIGFILSIFPPAYIIVVPGLLIFILIKKDFRILFGFLTGMAAFFTIIIFIHFLGQLSII